MTDDQPRPASNFVLFSIGQGVSAVGTWMQKTGVGWLAWELTHSPAWVGTVVLTDVLSALWVAPLAGTVADRSNPFRLILITQSLAILHAALLGWLAWSDNLSIWGLFAMALAESTIQGFNQPVRMTAVGHLAGRARLAQAIASNSMAFNLARTVGPAFAGFAIQHGGIAFNFWANAVSFLAMLAAVIHLRRWLDLPAASAPRQVGAEVIEGFRYILKTPEILYLMIITSLVSVLARPFAEMFPALVGAVFGGGPDTLALLMSSQGAGALAGALWMLWRRPTDTLMRTTLAGALGLSASLVVFSSSVAMMVAVPAMVAAGAFHVVFNIGMQSMAQLRAAPTMKGRVTGTYWLLFRCCPSLGAFVIGLAASLVGLQVLIGGGAVVAAALTILFVAGRRRAFGLRPSPAE
jgi:predicted MFS family arabinose efflux permease